MGARPGLRDATKADARAKQHRRCLVVTADDFGLSAGISRGIIGAHCHGVITATSALVVAPGFASTVPWLAEHPTLEAGVHVALVGEDPPLSPARSIPTLVDRQGRLPRSWRHLLPVLGARRIDPADIRTEATAQVAAARAAGIDRPTHLDTHQHVHLWPAVAAVLTEVAVAEGVPVVRVPRSSRPWSGWGVEVLGRRLAQRVDRAGLRHTDGFAGWDRAGHHLEGDVVAAVRALGRAGHRTAELALHPGHSDAAARDRYRWAYDWDGERSAACATRVRQAIAEAGFDLVGPTSL